jgi:hypothetical protein
MGLLEVGEEVTDPSFLCKSSYLLLLTVYHVSNKSSDGNINNLILLNSCRVLHEAEDSRHVPCKLLLHVRFFHTTNESGVSFN